MGPTTNARISTFISEPLDPAMGFQHTYWDELSSPSALRPPSPQPFSTRQSPQQEEPIYPVTEHRNQYNYPSPYTSTRKEPISPVSSSYPYKTFSSSSPSNIPNPTHRQSPEISPLLPALKFEPLRLDGNFPPTGKLSGNDYPLTPQPVMTTSAYGRHGGSFYNALPAPTVTMDMVDDYDGGHGTSYEPVRMTAQSAVLFPPTFELRPKSDNISRQPSTAERLGRLFGTVKGRARGSWGSGRHKEDEDEGKRGYVSLRGLEDGEFNEVYNVDLSETFQADFVPAATQRAMVDNKMDDRYAYTGTGETVDLSNLVGFEGEDDEVMPSPVRANTLENMDKQSYYFPPDRHVPNWKPVPMRTWFLCLLNFTTLGLLVCVEILYQLSQHGVHPAKKGLVTFTSVSELSLVQFSIWKYLPTLVAVLYGIIWKITDTEIKRAEPYYQLSRGTKGALAASSLNIEYQTFWSIFVPVAAVKHRQWLVVCSSVASLIAFTAVPTCLSVFITVLPTQKERNKLPPDIPKFIVVSDVFSRLLEGIFGIIIVLGIWMMWILYRRRSGLLGDPSGIAGVAAMANKSHILMDFKDLDLASEVTIHKQLNKRTYILHKGALWQAQLLKPSERNDAAPKPMNPHPLLLRPKGGLPFMIMILLVIALLPPMVFKTKMNFIVDKTPWVLTGVSTIIKSLWEIVEKDMRMLEPFWELWQLNADPGVLTLDYSATIPGIVIGKALSKRHFLLAWVCCVSLLVEVLTVVMGSLDASGGEESDLSWKISFGLAILILLTTFATQFLVLRYRGRAFLPRQPGTISSVLAFIHQSKMLVDFEGTEEQSTAERKTKLRKAGKRYGFGWFRGRDGAMHCGIDEGPVEKFSFGVDRRNQVIGGGDFGWDAWERGA
ncbi:hypothetical protein RUND412_005143 [Rhizina undulata]